VYVTVPPGAVDRLAGETASEKSGGWGISSVSRTSRVSAPLVPVTVSGYDEQPWVHMIIVPRDAIREAITP
jgi:hypothetical protein